MSQAIHNYAKSNKYDADVHQGARVLVHLLGGLTLQLIQRRIAYQPVQLANLVHDGIAGIQAEAAGNATQLLPIADIATGRAYLHALIAIDAIALRQTSFGCFTVHFAAMGSNWV